MSIASNDNDTQVNKERPKRPKRIIIEEDSEEEDSSDEDDVPLFQRKAVRDLPKLTVKKVKLSNVEDLEISKKKNINNEKTQNNIKDKVHINNGFKAPLPPKNNGFKAPLPTKNDIFKAPLSKNNNEFQAPLSYSSKGFKAPAPPSSGGFKAPSTTDFAAPLSKDPMANFTENHQSDSKYNKRHIFVLGLTLFNLRSNIE
jgi:hypothetical protein